MRPKIITPRGKQASEFALAMARADGRCEAEPKARGRCPANATEVIYDPDGGGPLGGGRYFALCRACRLAGVGLSSPEKTARTKAFKARQLSLFGGGSE